MESALLSPEEVVEEMGLVYITDVSPGITREAEADHYRYFSPSGKEITSQREIDRINALAIPPAYQKVWISPKRNGHLQATGIDAKGRKQYRYHESYREHRDEAKFARMVDFGHVLPSLRERVQQDMSLRGMPREKVLACIVYLLEHSLIRVGNEEYAKQNNSYGLTTMEARHVEVHGSEVRFSFLGKSKVHHDVELHDRRVTSIVKKLQDLPGQELFHFKDDEGNLHPVHSNDVNQYLKEIAGDEFTAKDFRTWAGTVLALAELAQVDEVPESQRALKRTITQAIKAVAEKLGNTPAVCRKSYIHPKVLNAFEAGALVNLLDIAPEAGPTVADLVEKSEEAVLRLLEEAEERKTA